MLYSALFWPGVLIAYGLVVFLIRLALRMPSSPAWTGAAWFLSLTTSMLLGLNASIPQSHAARRPSPDRAFAAVDVQHLSDAKEWAYRRAIHLDIQPQWFLPGELIPVVVFSQAHSSMADVEVSWDGPRRLRLRGALKPVDVYCREHTVEGVEILLEPDIDAPSCRHEAREQRLNRRHHE